MHLAPDLQAVLLELAEIAERTEQALTAEAIIARAMGGPSPLADAPHRHRRPRNLRILPGGLAAFALPGLFTHCVLPAAAATAGRWLWHSARARLVTTVLALATGAALAVPASGVEQAPAATVPHPHAIARVHHHRRSPATAAPAAPPLPQQPRRRRRAEHHHHHVAPSPSPSPVTSAPSPSPSPAPSPTLTLPPSPVPTLPDTPGMVTARRVLRVLHRLL